MIPSFAASTFEFLRQRRRAYQLRFGKHELGTEAVLADLAQFCRANESCFHADPRIHAALEGRREVWLRIMHHLKMPAEKQFELYGGPVRRNPDQEG